MTSYLPDFSSSLSPRLQPYDQGYRDGWHDIHISRRPRRLKRRRRNAEYALGYQHGRIDGARHPDIPRWWPDYARGSYKARMFRRLPSTRTAATGRSGPGSHVGPNERPAAGISRVAGPPRERVAS